MLVAVTGGQPMPGGLATLPSDPTTYYNITTTALLDGKIEICITYDEDHLLGEEFELALQHFEDPDWVDITSSHDMINSIICGITSSLSLSALIQADCCRLRGDINHDGAAIIDISDLLFLIDYMFNGGLYPPCHEEADVNADGGNILDISDLTYLIDFIFQGGPEPPPRP